MANDSQIKMIIGGLACLLSFLTFILGAASAGVIAQNPYSYTEYGGYYDYTYSEPWTAEIAVTAVLAVVFIFNTIVQGLLLKVKNLSNILLYVAFAFSVFSLALVIAMAAVTGKSGWLQSYPFLIPVIITFGLIAALLSVVAALLAKKVSNALERNGDESSTADLEAKAFASTQQQQQQQQQLQSVAYQAPTSVPATAFVPAPSPGVQYMQPINAPTTNLASQQQSVQHALPQQQVPAQGPARPNNPLLANAASFSPGH